MAKVLYKINRKQTGEPTAEEKWHDEMALKHYLKYCTSEKCIRDFRFKLPPELEARLDEAIEIARRVLGE